jgi:hypothetical protein
VICPESPVLSRMTTVTPTGFLMPFKFAPVTAAWKVPLLVHVRLILI